MVPHGRRRFLAATLGATVPAIAGCIGDTDEDDGNGGNGGNGNGGNGNGGNGGNGETGSDQHDGDEVPEIDPAAIDTEDRPALGDESAPVYVTVFEDYSCPHCRDYNVERFPVLYNDYVDPGDVRYLHADFPIPVDDTWSYAVASAARAVHEAAGNEGFWAFTESIYPRLGEYSYDVIANVAEEVAGVGATARSAAEEDAYREVLDSDRDLGVSWGVGGTPTVFVGDEPYGGNEMDEIESAIEARL